MKSKLESLLEGSECKERQSTPDGVEYCRGNIADCPYKDKARFVTIPSGSYHPCTYFNTFDGFITSATKGEVKKE
jgi:hypothetical protein